MAGNGEGARMRTSRLGELGALVKEGDGSWGVSVYGEPPLAVWTGSPPSKRPSSTGHRKVHPGSEVGLTRELCFLFPVYGKRTYLP